MQFLCNRWQRLACSFVEHQRSSRDYPQRRYEGDGAKQFFRQAIGEVFLRGIAGQVFERQNRYGINLWPVLRARMIPGWRRAFNRGNKAITVVWQGFDETRFLGVVPQRSANFVDGFV